MQQRLSWCWLVACSNTLLYSGSVWVCVWSEFFFSLTLHQMSSRASQTFDSLFIYKSKKYQFVCVQDVLPWQLPNLWPPPPSNISNPHLLRFCCASPLPWKRTHTHIFQGRRKDSERLWNPSDPSMQSNQHARETLNGSLFCHDCLHTQIHTLTDCLGSVSLFSVLAVSLEYCCIDSICTSSTVVCE